MALLPVTATITKGYSMSFDEILNNNSLGEDQKKALMSQALRRAEYNRQYQAKLRAVSRLLTLEKRIDTNLGYVLGYIKSRYSKEYDEYVPPVAPELPVNVLFDNWYVLAAQQYKSVREAFNLSGLNKHMNFKTFCQYFERYFKENNTGDWVQY